MMNLLASFATTLCICTAHCDFACPDLDELFSRPAPVLSAAPAAPVAPRQPSPAPAPPQTVTPPTTSPVAPMPSPAEQARMERERQRKREQERRRREAQVNKLTVSEGFAANFVQGSIFLFIPSPGRRDFFFESLARIF